MNYLDGSSFIFIYYVIINFEVLMKGSIIMHNKILNLGDKVGIISCSDGIKIEKKDALYKVKSQLEEFKLNVILSKTIFRSNNEFSATGEERAQELMNLFRDKSIKAIFDMSGGDIANEILPFLDYKSIQKNDKPYFGISDLSVILNSLYSCSKIGSYHYSIQNLVRENSKIQKDMFLNSFFYGKDDIYNFKYRWLRKGKMQGIVIGGNIRCFLKLSGTNYLPDPANKILLLESLGGSVAAVISYMMQFKQMGYFKNLSGIILGEFTKIQKERKEEAVEKYILGLTKDLGIPIIRTESIGHSSNAICIKIGEKYSYGI